MKKMQKSARRQKRLGGEPWESGDPRTVRQRYKSLIEWVRFANGQEESDLGVPLMATPNPASAREILINIARALPPLPRTRAIDKALLKVRIRRGRPQHWIEFLIGALAGRIDRLRICPMCENPFVALDERAETCSNNCRQQKFYKLHPQEQRDRKKEEYASSRRLRRKTGRPGLRGRERAERTALADALRSLD
jgi:hypothetical protein